MDTSAILDEVARLERQITKWEEERQALDAKIIPAREELGYWSGILKLRSSDNEIPPSTSQPVPLLTMVSTPEEGREAYGAKTRALRSFIKSRIGSGVTVSELVEESKRLGSHPNMAYRFIDRLTKTKPPELEKRGDRIYSTEHLKG